MHAADVVPFKFSHFLPLHADDPASPSQTPSVPTYPLHSVAALAGVVTV